MLNELLLIASIPAVQMAWNELCGTCPEVLEDGMTFYDFCQEIRMAT